MYPLKFLKKKVNPESFSMDRDRDSKIEKSGISNGRSYNYTMIVLTSVVLAKFELRLTLIDLLLDKRIEKLLTSTFVNEFIVFLLKTSYFAVN